MMSDRDAGREGERARIVAALRQYAGGREPIDVDDQHVFVLWSAADAIERGEL